MGKTLYYYDGISLKKYCKNNDISYPKILNRIKQITNNHPDYDIDKVISFALSSSFNSSKYYYKGVLLIRYCEDNNLNYDTIRKRIYTLKNKYPNTSLDDIIDIAINKTLNDSCKYYYNGVSLYEYCKNKDVDYMSIKGRINYLKKNGSNLYDVNIVKFVIEEYKDFRKYYYNGITLYRYCIINKISYHTVIDRIYKLLNDGYSIEECIEKSINDDFSNNKYYYNGIPITKYCRLNDLDYNKMISYLKNLNLVDKKNISDELINRFTYKCKLRDIKYFFRNYDNLDNITINKYIDILEIDRESIKYLISNNFNLKQAINFIWYFGVYDEKYKINNEIFDYYTNFNYQEKFDLKELIGLYKSGVKDTREEMYRDCFFNVRKVKSEIFKKYPGIYSSDLEEELNDIGDCTLMEIFENNCCNEKGQILNYLMIILRYKMYEYIKDYFNNKKTKVLDNLEKVDYYEDSFSTITVDLPKDLRNILTLKFVYLYDFYDISRILKISFDEVVEKYNLAIKYLRDDKKVLVYKRG